MLLTNSMFWEGRERGKRDWNTKIASNKRAAHDNETRKIPYSILMTTTDTTIFATNHTNESFLPRWKGDSPTR